MRKVIIEYDPSVPTECHPDGMAFWWLAVNVGTKNEAYTSFICRPTQRQIRNFKKLTKQTQVR
jgi:hypothetical protein